MTRNPIISAMAGALAAAAFALAGPATAHADDAITDTTSTTAAITPEQEARALANLRIVWDAIRTGQIESTVPLAGLNGMFDLPPAASTPAPAAAAVKTGRNAGRAN